MRPVETNEIRTEILPNVREDQRQFDRRMASWIGDFQGDGGRVYCARGCKNCCNLVVNATLPEAMLVAEQLSGAHRVALRAHVARLAEAIGSVTDLKDYLRLHRKKIGDCPFLDADGSCGVYQVRPFSCRALLSTRNRDWCAVDFADLHPAERQAFMSGLDRSVVAFPTHYLSHPQHLALTLEQNAARAMKDHCGFAIRGNLTVQVLLLVDHELERSLAQGLAQVRQIVQRAGWAHPLLLG